MLRKEVSGYKWINPKDIKIVLNPRTINNPGFTPERMTELRNGIIKDGLNHPLTVWYNDGAYRLLGGERRLRTILKLLEDNVDCRHPTTGEVVCAKKAYEVVLCKPLVCESEREAKRLARQDNMLHEQLTDFEVLLQVEEMEKDKFSRTEQAEDFAKSEAWISQSHSLLGLCKAYPPIKDAMFSGELGRTQALQFLPVWDKTPDKVGEVFEAARQTRFALLQDKHKEAVAEEDQALHELDLNESQLRIAERMGGEAGETEPIRSARRKVRRSQGRANKASEKLSAVQANLENPHLTVEDITGAATKTRGTETVLNRPQTVKNVRQYAQEIQAIVDKSPDSVENIDNAKLLLRTMEWFVGNYRVGHPLELLKDAV